MFVAGVISVTDAQRNLFYYLLKHTTKLVFLCALWHDIINSSNNLVYEAVFLGLGKQAFCYRI